MLAKNKLWTIFQSFKKYFLWPFSIHFFLILLLINAFGLRLNIFSSAHLILINIFLGYGIFFSWFIGSVNQGKKITLLLQVIKAIFVVSGLISICSFSSLVAINEPLNSFSINLLIGAGLILGYYYSPHNRKTTTKDIAFSVKPVLHSKKRLNYILLGLITLAGFYLRIINLDYIQGSDLFNLSSAKALFDTGHFFYERNLLLTYLIAFVFKAFSPTLFFAKLPLALMGTISIYLIYRLGKFINTKIGLLCALLLAISPVAIEESTIIREYSENLLIALLVYIVVFYLVKNKYPAKILYGSLGILCALIYIYSNLLNNYTCLLIIIVIGYIAVACMIILNLGKSKSSLYFAIASSLLFAAVGSSYIHLVSSAFYVIGYEPYWFHSFFLPTIQFPMQWFSSTIIPEVFLIFLFCVPLFITRNRLIYISYVSFFAIVALFVFKYNNTLSYVPTRYTYILYPFYILIFSTAIYKIQRVFRNTLGLRLITICLLSLIFINPSNIKHAALHDLVSNWPYSDKTRPTSIGTRRDVSELIQILKERNLVDGSNPIVLTDFNPSWLILNFNINTDPGRSFSDKGEYRYDIGQNIFLENDYWQVFELENTVKNHKSGIYITRTSRKFASSEKFQLAKFELAIDYQGFEVYSWKR